MSGWIDGDPGESICRMEESRNPPGAGQPGTERGCMKRDRKGEGKAETEEYWCEICGAACDEITEETFPDLRKARTLCPGCRKSYEDSCRL